MTATRDLTDRYVHAVTRNVPTARRDDLARELTGSIEDMIAARTDAGEEPGDAERAVLTELGHPGALAAQYADAPLHLIGPRYFLTYRWVLTVALTWAPGVVGVITAVSVLADSDNGWSALGQGIGTAFEVAVHVFCWTTLAFAILERTTAGESLPEWSVDSLPEVPTRHGQQVGLADAVSGVVVTLVVAGYLVLQRFHSWVPGDGGDNVPVFDPGLWSFWLPFLIVVLLSSAALEVWKYVAGLYTWPIVGGVAVTSVAFAVPTVWLAATDRLLSRAFVEVLDFSASALDTVNTVVVVAVLAVEIGTVIDAVVKARRASAPDQPEGGVR
ncbi:MAG: permease prefix domain 1-containing protein [Aeromicrobium sp.]|uniref:permease prefix domain 1-containing protein n=1 Tax=Aeromicrobium sp. TaxID=1871063 RepID=UPI0039E5F5DD